MLSSSGGGWVAEMAKDVELEVWGHPRPTPAPGVSEMQQILDFSGAKMWLSGNQW